MTVSQGKDLSSGQWGSYVLNLEKSKCHGNGIRVKSNQNLYQTSARAAAELWYGSIFINFLPALSTEGKRCTYANQVMMFKMKLHAANKKISGEMNWPFNGACPNVTGDTMRRRLLLNSCLGDRFCLMVKKGYRDPPYHNWMHAFSVSHFCYLLYKNLGLSNYLE